VQGHLFGEKLSVEIRTECGCCGRSMHLTVTSDLDYEVHDAGAEPLAFEPEVDWTSFTDPNIIHGY
jgi:hypothetical protein